MSIFESERVVDFLYRCMILIIILFRSHFDEHSLYIPLKNRQEFDQDQLFQGSQYLDFQLTTYH